ncbi:MAG: MFS transporter [Chloroflexi bacterium]|nr:MFS transporter [Chloroflexota bacterium]
MANALYSVTTSGLLAAFALALGANSLHIGILAAIPFLMQPIQIPTILLVERLRMRKVISVLAWLPAQSLWVPIALIPVILPVPSLSAVFTLIGLLAVRAALAGVCNCAWFGWVKDLVPPDILGRFHAQRLSYSTLAAILFGLAGAVFIDLWRGFAASEHQVIGYTLILLPAAIIFGLGDPWFMSRMPEPAMALVTGQRPSLRDMLSAPLGNSNFRRLLRFLFTWAFASNLATPFFAVYMLVQLGYPVSAVMALAVTSQVFNAIFMRVWGPYVDRFGSKAVMSLSTSLYLLVILGWVFTTMPESHILTIPIIIALHVFSGVATAGLNLTVNTIGYKLAPKGEATAYLAVASLATSLGAGLSPLFGGWLADFVQSRGMTLSFGLNPESGGATSLTVLLSGFDFLFVGAFVMGMLTLNMLALVSEEGEVNRSEVITELFTPSQQMTRGISSVPGLRFVTQFPYGYLRHIPGVDVALGVTAYQFATIARTAVKAAVVGEHAVGDVARRVTQGLLASLQEQRVTENQGENVAGNVSRGAYHELDKIAGNRRSTARAALEGVIEALSKASSEPEDLIWGVGYGATQVADEVGMDLGDAVLDAVAAVKDAAESLGVAEDEAASIAADGAMQAAADIGENATRAVRSALPAPTPEPVGDHG